MLSETFVARALLRAALALMPALAALDVVRNPGYFRSPAIAFLPLIFAIDSWHNKGKER
jgi:hypothetical protein